MNLDTNSGGQITSSDDFEDGTQASDCRLEGGDADRQDQGADHGEDS